MYSSSINPTTISMKLVNSCNLACVYCYETKNFNDFSPKIMPLTIIEKVMRDLSKLESGNIQFIWHGGEPLLAGLDYFTEILSIQKIYFKKKLIVTNCLQTNGILLSEEWINFAINNKFGIGVSFDGPPIFHNSQRPMRNLQSSHEKVFQSIKLLQSKEFPFIISCVVTKKGINSPEAYWNFFKVNKINEFDFLPCMPNINGFTNKNYSVSNHEFMKFLKDIFALWVNEDDDSISIKYLENVLLNMIDGYSSNFCQLSGNCKDFYTITTDGYLYPCDFFVGLNNFVYGSVFNIDVSEALINENNKIKQFLSKGLENCHNCEWINVCNGGCPFHHLLSKHQINYESVDCVGKKILFEYVQKTILESLC